jgi:hypothetical protein
MTWQYKGRGMVGTSAASLETLRACPERSRRGFAMCIWPKDTLLSPTLKSQGLFWKPLGSEFANHPFYRKGEQK